MTVHRLTGESLLRRLARRRARRLIVSGDPLCRLLGPLDDAGLDIISTSIDPFTRDLHSAFLLRRLGRDDTAFLAPLADADPPAEGEATTLRKAIDAWPPGSPRRGVALYAALLALAARERDPGTEWAPLMERLAGWAVERVGSRHRHHQAWGRAPAEMLRRQTAQALLLLHCPTPAEGILRRQATRLGYPDSPARLEEWRGLADLWAEDGIERPRVVALVEEEDLPAASAAFKPLGGLESESVALGRVPAVLLGA